MYPRSGFRSRGTTAKTTLLENHPSVNPPPCSAIGGVERLGLRWAKTHVLKMGMRVSKRALKKTLACQKMLEASSSIGRQRVGAFKKR